MEYIQTQKNIFALSTKQVEVQVFKDLRYFIEGLREIPLDDAKNLWKKREKIFTICRCRVLRTFGVGIYTFVKANSETCCVRVIDLIYPIVLYHNTIFFHFGHHLQQ